VPKPKENLAASLFFVAALSLFYAGRTDYFHSLIRSYPTPAPLDPVAGLLMKVVLSVTFGAASLYIILSQKYGPKDKHWAYGIAGLIIGFWLR
jgi:hypothetical protein